MGHRVAVQEQQRRPVAAVAEVDAGGTEAATPFREQGRVQVQWIRHDSLVYASLFCGNVETGEVSWS
jgi:hypothetical protein